MPIYDAAIVGSGPAGVSAALNLKLHNRTLIWFGAPQLSDNVRRSQVIANYPGLPMIGGDELNRRMMQQLADMQLTPVDRRVTNILPSDAQFTLLADNEIYEANTLLLATGYVAPRGLPGEQQLLGRGVSYCATCDGFLYRGKTIAVFCGAPRYEHEVRYLAGLAGRVYLFAGYRDCQVALPNLERPDARMRKILGSDRAEAVELTDGSRLAVDGVFFLRDAVAPATLLPGLTMDGPHIAVDRNCRTNVPRCYAAGDCTGRPYQIAKAVGEGNVAAHQMLEDLAQLDKQSQG